MSATAAVPAAPPPEVPREFVVGRYQVKAAIAFFLVVMTVFQTLVLTALTGDVIRLGIEVDPYDELYISVAWGTSILFGIFMGMWLAPRIGSRHTLVLGLAVFAVGNLFCGAATGLMTMIASRIVEGIGKGAAMVMARSTLYRQFDRALIVAIAYYGVFAYATRHTSPLIAAYLNEWLSWRWIYWANVPASLLGVVAVLCFVRPDPPPQAKPDRLDWITIALVLAWIAAQTFAFGWYRRWGGWSSNAFVGTVALCLALPVALAARLFSGRSPDEHLNRILRTRVYVLAFGVRTLLIVHMAAVLTIMGQYLVSLREYPRITAGWIIAPVTLTMAATTILTLIFHPRSLRHVWLIVGVLGASACVWGLSAIDNFTAKERIGAMLACWGAFLGLLTPVFLLDEVEGVDPRDVPYGGAIGTVGLVIPLTIIPIMTGTVTQAWSDRALDTLRLNLRENRPPVEEAVVRNSDYYRRRGLAESAASSAAADLLKEYATRESIALGYRRGLRFLSVVLLVFGLGVAIPLSRAARGLRAPPGTGYS